MRAIQLVTGLANHLTRHIDSGFLVFSYHYNMKAISGILIALVGVICYTEFKRRGVGSTISTEKVQELSSFSSTSSSAFSSQQKQQQGSVNEERMELLGEDIGDTTSKQQQEQQQQQRYLKTSMNINVNIEDQAIPLVPPTNATL